MAIYLGRNRVSYSGVKIIKVKASSVSGTSRLKLAKTIGDEIENLVLYGNITQNGTPTTETPIEVESVGERTKNLFNIDTYGSLLDERNQPYIFDISKCEVGTKLTLSTTDVYYYKISNLAGGAGDYQYKANKYTFTLTQAQIDLGRIFIISTKNWTPETKENLKTQNVQLQYGDSATDYEPYGYKVPVKVSGKNLINLENMSITLTGQRSRNTYTDFKLVGGKTYTLSFDYDIASISNYGSYYFLAIGYGELNTFSNDIANKLYDSSVMQGRMAETFTVPDVANDLYLSFRFLRMLNQGNAQYTISNIQLEESNTLSNYEPYIEPKTTNIYLDEPLRKIGDYADYIDYKNKKVVRKTHEYTFTGNEDFINVYGESLFMVRGLFTNKPFILGYGISNYYTYNEIQSGIDANTKNGEFALQLSSGFYNVFFKNTNYTTVEDFKQYLQNLYNKGLPVKVVYVLATPTEETIDVPKIKNNWGNTVYTIETKVEPSQTKIDYWEQV